MEHSLSHLEDIIRGDCYETESVASAFESARAIITSIMNGEKTKTVELSSELPSELISALDREEQRQISHLRIMNMLTMAHEDALKKKAELELVETICNALREFYSSIADFTEHTAEYSTTIKINRNYRAHVSQYMIYEKLPHVNNRINIIINAVANSGPSAHKKLEQLLLQFIWRYDGENSHNKSLIRGLVCDLYGLYSEVRESADRFIKSQKNIQREK